MGWLNQAIKGRVFYLIDKCFETGADPRNIFYKQILKLWTPLAWVADRQNRQYRLYQGISWHIRLQRRLDAMCVGILLRESARDFGVEFESSRHREIFKIISRAVKKL